MLFWSYRAEHIGPRLMLKTRNSFATAALILTVVSLLPTQLSPSKAATAGAGSPLTEQAMDGNIAAMEKRFFSHPYANDPVEKRLERLELLVFGATQGGDVAERYSRLKKAIASRQSAGAGKVAPGHAGSAGVSNASQYPAVSALESKVLKRTYPNEPLGTRLSRLEKTVFGAANPAMAYADRVDRLKRTLQGAIAAQQPSPPFRLGPAPKARPRGFEGNGDFFSYTPRMNSQSDDDFFSDDGIGMIPGFGMGLPGGLSGMMRQMERQMRQMQSNLPPGNGVWTLDPKTGTWIEQNTGKRYKPGAPGGSATPFQAPQLSPKALPLGPRQHNDSELPPYSDPNSI